MTKPKPQGYQKINYNNAFLRTFCSSNLIVIQNKLEEKINRDTKIEGKCENIPCINKFYKTLRTLLDKNGYCKLCIQEKINIERSKNLHIINKKQKETCIKKYGVNSFFETDIFKNKAKDTWTIKYGCDNPIKSTLIKETRKEQFKKKYGVENPSQLKSIIELKKQTCIGKYGVEYPMQNQEIMEKSSKNSYRRKTYTFPSGNQITCQGYEPFALDKLIKEENIDENDVVTGCKNVPTIWYNDDNCKKHRHYVDIFIPSQNRCIEVKSTWTAKKNEDKIYLKQIAAKKLGYEDELWIYNAKKELVECHK
jgi:hypothetical protein